MTSANNNRHVHFENNVSTPMAQKNVTSSTGTLAGAFGQLFGYKTAAPAKDYEQRG
jgi:hypothetical protein